MMFLSFRRRMWQSLRIVAIGVTMIGLPAVCRAAEDYALLDEVIRQNLFQFNFEQGRIAFDVLNAGSFERAASGPERRNREKIAVHINNGVASMTYEQSNAREKLRLDVSSDQRFRFLRTPLGKSAATIEFVQVPDAKISLTIGSSENPTVYQAASLWHLLIMRPQECQQDLMPFLDHLCPGQHRMEMKDAVEACLLQEAERDAASERARWTEWVAQLGDDRFARREAADRELRATDPRGAAYLRQLDLKRLDAEQQFRMYWILRSFADRDSDESPEQVAASLASDPTIWLAMVQRPEPATRRVAARQLTLLLGEPISMDPDADPATQQTAWEQLRARLHAE